MIACAVTDLPEPDSPTSATVLPGRTRNERPFTASTRPAMVRNSTDRSLMREKVVDGGTRPQTFRRRYGATDFCAGNLSERELAIIGGAVRQPLPRSARAATMRAVSAAPSRD